MDADEFADMILKTDTDGRLVRLRDVARIELGAQAYDQTCTLDQQALGRPFHLSAPRLERASDRAGWSATRWRS